MLTFAWLLLKVLLCSGILFGYYWAALRNKRFHSYNRFYLLASVVLSWLIPLIKIDFWNAPLQQPQIVKLLTVVSGGDRFVEQAANQVQIQSAGDWSIIPIIVFVFISAIIFTRLIVGLIKLMRLVNSSAKQKWNDIYFVLSSMNGTPFSFFKYIFWNNDINLASPEGQHILKHELAHVREHHSADKMFINLALVAGWFSPFMWLISKELNMIHEFIADEKAVSDGDTTALANMLLKAVYPSYSFPLSNTFFYSPIKRRLLMISSSKKASFSYLRRLAILLLLPVILLFFAFRLKDEKDVAAIGDLQKKYTVIIDAGHGGKDAGGKGLNGVSEKEMVLQLGKLVKALNTNDQIEILLTRETDEYLLPQQRLQFLESKKADLLVSLHLQATAPMHKNGVEVASLAQGPEIYISKNTLFDRENKIFGSILSGRLQSIFGIEAALKTRENGIHILDDNKVCPAVLIECGYLSNKKDLQILSDENKLKEISKEILKSIEEYFYHRENTAVEKRLSEEYEYTGSMNEQYTDSAFKKKENKAKADIGKTIKIANVTFTDSDGEAHEIADAEISIPRGSSIQVKELIILDGKPVEVKELNEAIEPALVKEVRVLKGEMAINKYGDKGLNGVIEITSIAQSKLKPWQKIRDDQPKYNRIFTEVENPPYYLNGMMAFADYINNNVQYPKEAIKNQVEGAVTIQFIVSDEGKLTDFKKLSNKGYGLEEEAIRLIKNSGEWKAGIQNGHKVPVQIVQQITFKLPEAL